MPSISGDLRFFGLDLNNAWQQLRQPWLRMHEWPLLRWLTPAPPIRLMRADGGEVCWHGVRRCVAVMPNPVPRLQAVELPDDIVLRRQLLLPAMSAADVAQALTLQVHSFSPFAQVDLVWGWRMASTADGQALVDLALASRKRVAGHLEQQAPRLSDMTTPEVWVCPDQGEPIVMAGYGEGRRTQDAVRQRRIGYGLLVCAALLLAAMGLTPSMQLWLRAQEAQRGHQELALRARPALVEREAMQASMAQLNALAEVLSSRVDPLRLLELLTRVLPDDTAVQNLKLQGQSVTISGQTGDAARLMQLLGEQEGLREVRAPTPATRLPGASKENFTVAFVLDLKAFGVDVAAEASSAKASVASASSAEIESAPRAAASSPLVAPVLPASASSGQSGVEAPVAKPSSGGRAVFGGSATAAAVRPVAPASKGLP